MSSRIVVESPMRLRLDFQGCVKVSEDYNLFATVGELSLKVSVNRMSGWR